MNAPEARKLLVPAAASWIEPFDGAATQRLEAQWQGLDLVIEIDGWAGIDGRLTPEALAALPSPLRAVLGLDALAAASDRAAGALLPAAIEGPAWRRVRGLEPGAAPLPAALSFALRLPGAPGWTRGRLALAAADAPRFAERLIALGLPLPPALAWVEAYLRIGSVPLDAAALQSLEPGDLVWLDDAELAAAGLRAEVCLPGAPLGREAGVPAAWLRGSRLMRDRLRSARQSPATGAGLEVRSPPGLRLPRDWCLGRGEDPRLPGTALTLDWFIGDAEGPLAAGRLMRVGRRLGLRLTRCFSRGPSPAPSVPTGDSYAGPGPVAVDPQPGADRRGAVPGRDADLLREAGGGVQPGA